MDPVKYGNGSCQRAPMPNPRAAAVSSLAFRFSDALVNAVPQACAKSVLNSGCVPRFGSVGLLEKVSPPTVLAARHGVGVLVRNPVASSAAVDTMVKACPGR